MGTNRTHLGKTRISGSFAGLDSDGALLLDVADLVVSTFPKSIQVKSELPGDLWPVAANASQFDDGASDDTVFAGTAHLTTLVGDLAGEPARLRHRRHSDDSHTSHRHQ